MIGENIFQYEILEKLGSGGMGEVYLAEDTKLNRKVALKFLPIHFASDKALKTRFINEAQAAAKLNHPNIITIFEVNEYENRPFFVMEYVEGKPLTEIIGTEELSSDKAVDITIQICDGLKEAHKLGITHRDIKPSNIIIDESGRCRILDFGLAAVQSEERLTKTGSLLGTVEYMSPEQVRGEKVDHRSDIFSLGVLLYEMLTGQLPFKGDYAAGVIYSIINESPELLSEYKSDIPEAFQMIIDKALEKDPESRYQHIDELQSDLKKLIAEKETALLHQPFGNIKTIKRILIPASAIFIAILLFLLFKTWRIIIEPDQPAAAAENRLAVMYFDNLADPEDSQKLGEIATNLLITDLSESQYLQVVSNQRLYDILKLLGKEGMKKVDRDVASLVAEEAKAKWMLMGSILQIEPNIIMTTQLVDVANGSTIASQRVAADDNEDIFSLIDNLTVEIKSDLSLPAAAREEPDPLVADVTTTSPEAYRYYLEGLDFHYKSYDREAIASFRKALEHDSTLAMAYCYLYTYDAVYDNPEARRLIAKALEYSDKTSQREKLLIKSEALWISGKYDQANEELRKLVLLYPEDKEAYVRLADRYMTFNKPLEAIKEFEAALEIDSLYKYAYNSLAYAYSKYGDYEKAIRAINKYITLAPDEANPYDSRGDIYRNNGEIDKAIESYKKALEIKSDNFTTLFKLGNIYILEQKYLEAESLFVRICSTNDNVRRSRARSGLAYIRMYQGKFNEALEILDKGIAGDEIDGYDGIFIPQKHFLKAMILNEQNNFELAAEEFEKAIEMSRPIHPQTRIPWLFLYPPLLAENNDFIKAEEMLKAVKKDLEKEDPIEMWFYWYAVGCIEYYRGNPDAALNYFEKGPQDIYGTTWYVMHYMLGLTYLKIGKIEEAIKEFEVKAGKYTSSRTFWSIRQVKSYYYLGIAYERSGWRNKAIEQYEEFLDIWKDADPGTEEIDDAKARLARLKQET